MNPTRNRYFDKLGRLIREQVQSFGDDSTWDRVERRYDAQGLIRRVSEPYAAAEGFETLLPSSTGECADASSKAHRCVTYDNLGRPTAEVRADGGSVTWRYNTVASDSRVRVKRAETVKSLSGTVTTTLHTVRDYSLTGELTKLVEGGASSDSSATGAVATEYVWYGTGLLESVTVNDNYKTSFQYDAVGNRTQVINPNFSTVTLRYTALGELYERLDSKGRTEWEYDKLGRALKRIDPDGVSEWEWDPKTSRGSLWKRCRDDTAGRRTVQRRTAFFGNLHLRERRCPIGLGGDDYPGGLMKSYTRTYTHDGSGRLSTVAYPSGLTGQTGVQHARLPVEAEKQCRLVPTSWSTSR